MSLRKKKGKSLIEFPNKYIAFDIETTGLDPMYDEIIEIGAIKIENGREVQVFNTLVKPEYEINEFISKLTGITNEVVKKSPSIDEVLSKFIEFIGDLIILGHNVNFDINFIYDNLVKFNMKPITNDFIDTLRLSRRLLPELKHHRLSDLADYYNINAVGSHRSLKDVRMTIEVYNNLEILATEKYHNIDNFKNACKTQNHSGFKASDVTANNTEFEYQKISDENEIKKIVAEYVNNYFDINDDKQTWFNKMKDLAEKLGYAREVKEYKANPEMYKGHVGDISTVIRVTLTGRANTPDLYEIIEVLGEKEVKDRLNAKAE